MNEVLLDWEVYPNFVLCGIESYESRELFRFEIRESGYDSAQFQTWRWIMDNFTVVTFNGNHYDMLLCRAVYSGIFTLESLNAISRAVVSGQHPREVCEEFKIPNYRHFRHIDLKEVCPLTGSLKLYAARLHAPKIQELPYECGVNLTEPQIQEVIDYNVNDLDCTGLIRHELDEQIKMRRRLTDETGIDVMSKSDAQIAEALISAECERELGHKIKVPTVEPGSTVKCPIARFIHFRDEKLIDLMYDIGNTKFEIDDHGSIRLPESIADRKIYIGSGCYRLGIGGLHSSEQNVRYVSDESRVLIDADVASFYPEIIRKLEIFPKQIGRLFLKVYGAKIDYRLALKAAKDPGSEGWKIVINGTFGKQLNKWSKLYNPAGGIAVTLNGQLSLLMLIEMLEGQGINVVSANTDGVLSYPCRNQIEAFNDVLTAWQLMTGFKLEQTNYKAIYSRDVNSYIALKEDGKYKTKGAYKNPWDSNYGMPPIFRFHGNPDCQVCTEAVVKFLVAGISIENAICGENDFRKFIVVRTVKGGATHRGLHVGKVVRWYYGIQGCEMKYVTSGNKVPVSDGSVPCMELPDSIPADLDRDRYIKIAYSILDEVGFTGGNLFNA